MDISSDGGATWDMVSSSVSGDIGSGVIGGVKTITWDAKTDFPNQQISNMQVRQREIRLAINPVIHPQPIILWTL